MEIRLYHLAQAATLEPMALCPPAEGHRGRVASWID